MNYSKRKLLTIVTEAVIERQIVEDLKRLGIHGYTLVEARGWGTHGSRSAQGEQDRNVRIEAICELDMADSIVEYLKDHYYRHFAMITFLQDVEVLRPEKF
jgi:nitrogen regulatory protein PII